MSKSLLDPDFKYTPAEDTDIRKTFAKVRQRMKAEARALERKSASAPPGDVRTMNDVSEFIIKPKID